MLHSTDLDLIEQNLLGAMRSKLRVRARSLPRAMKRAGRMLPREAHRAADVLTKARILVANPKLARLIDQSSLKNAEATILRHLEKIDPKKRRMDALLSMAGAQALNLLGVGLLVVCLLAWRGLI